MYKQPFMHLTQAESSKCAWDEGEPVFSAGNMTKNVCSSCKCLGCAVALCLASHTHTVFMTHIPGECISANNVNNIFYIIVRALIIFPLIPKPLRNSCITFKKKFLIIFCVSINMCEINFSVFYFPFYIWSYDFFYIHMTPPQHEYSESPGCSEKRR